MKVPSINQACEICEKADNFELFDARVKQGPYGAKGHWVYICKTCHEEWGLGIDGENLMVFQRFFGKYREVKWKEKNLTGDLNSKERDSIQS
jgi:hypothetical protein